MNFTDTFYAELTDFWGNVFTHKNYRGDYDAGAWFEDVEQKENGDILIYLRFWSKYGQIVVDKGFAKAGWMRRIKSNGIILTFQLHFDRQSMYQWLVTADVNWRGHIGKATFLIEDDEAVFDTEYEQDEDYPSTEYYSEIAENYHPFVYCDRHQTGAYLKKAIACTMEAIKRSLNMAIELTGQEC